VVAERRDCPVCGAPDWGAERCSSCDADLRAPELARYAQLVGEIEELRREWGRVREQYEAREEERRQLAAAMNARRKVAPPPPPPLHRPRPEQPPKPMTAPSTQSNIRRDRTEWSADRVRDVLLWTGGLLLVLAIVSFVAVLWTRDDDGRPFWTAGRVGLLLFVLTIVAAVVAVRLRRHLPATAEVVGVLVLALAATDWYAVRRAGIATSVEPALWWSIGAALGTVVAIGAGRIGFRGPRIIAPILGQISLMCAFTLLDDPVEWAVAYAIGSALSVLVASKLLSRASLIASVRTLLIGAALFEVVGLVSAAAAFGDVDDNTVFQRTLAVAALGLAPAVARWSYAGRLGRLRHVAHALVATTAFAIEAAIVTATNPSSGGVVLAVGAVVGGLAISVAVALPEVLRKGVAIGGALMFGLAAAVASISTVATMLLPLSWIGQPWDLDISADAAEHLIAGESTSASGVEQWSLVAFGIGAAVAVLLASRKGRMAAILPAQANRWIVPTALTWCAVGAVGVLPKYPGVPVVAAWGSALVVALAMVAIAAPRERARPTWAVSAFVASLLPYASSLGWSFTHRALTVAEFAATALVLSWSASRAERIVTRSLLASLALSGVLATSSSACLALGTSVEAAGFALLVVAIAALLVVASRGAPDVVSRVLEATALGGLAVGTALTAGAVSWLAPAFTLLTVGFALAATRPSRHVYGWAALGTGAAAVLAWFAAAGVGASAEGLVLAAMSGIVLVVACFKRGSQAATIVEWLAILGLSIGSSIAAERSNPAWLAGSLTIASVALAVAAVLPGSLPGHPYLAAATIGGAVSAWLATADVRVPEAYSMTWAAVALGSGWWLRRQRSRTSSWIAYGPGLVIALAPTTAIAIAHDELPRTLLALGGGLVALAIGAQRRLQAPLLLGAGTMAVIGIDAIAPAAAGLPRWIPLAIVGLLLVWVGATAERRLAQARQLRDLIGQFD